MACQIALAGSSLGAPRLVDRRRHDAQVGDRGVRTPHAPQSTETLKGFLAAASWSPTSSKWFYKVAVGEVPTCGKRDEHTGNG